MLLAWLSNPKSLSERLDLRGTQITVVALGELC